MESLFDEDKTTLEYMAAHGVERVRGGTHSQVVLPPEQLAAIEQQMRTAQDRCLRCGSDAHFAAHCPGATKEPSGQGTAEDPFSNDTSAQLRQRWNKLTCRVPTQISAVSR